MFTEHDTQLPARTETFKPISAENMTEPIIAIHGQLMPPTQKTKSLRAGLIGSSQGHMH